MKAMVTILITLLIISISIADSIWIPSRPNPEPIFPEVGSSATSSEVKFADKTTDSSTGSSGTSLPYSFDPYDYSGDQLQLNRWINPDSTDYILPNRIYTINSDLKGVRRELRNIIIKEQVGANLDINSIVSAPTIYDPFNESDNYPLDNQNYTITDKYIMINISKLKPLYHINYSYNIKTPRKAVTSKIKTSIRINKIEPKVLDYEFSQDILIRPPKFDVNVDIAELNIDGNNPVKITYYIKYNSPCSSVGHYCPITFETSNVFDIFLNESFLKKNIPYDGSQINEIINYDNYKLQTIIVRYKQDGPYHLPSITIDGDHHIFDDQIVVASWIVKEVNKYYPLISILLVLISLILYIFEIHSLKQEIRGKKQSARNEKPAIYPGHQKTSVMALAISILIFVITILSIGKNNIIIIILFIILILINAVNLRYSFRIW